jgi:hypothetical protein
MATIHSSLILIGFIWLQSVLAYKTDCKFTEYSGGPGQVIATFTPTLPGNVSLSGSSTTWNMLSSIFGGIPVVGGALSSLFGIIGVATDNTIDNMMILEEAINTLIADINKTVYDLKEYTDAKFEEYDYDQKVLALHGIYYSAGYCASFSIPDNQLDCLKNLNLDITELYPTFFPTDPKYETFEQLLPLTRHYIDLQMAVLVDIIALTNKDVDYTSHLATFSVIAYNFYVSSVLTIVQEHKNNSINSVQCQALGWKPSDNIICFYYDQLECHTEWDNGDGCSLRTPGGSGYCAYSCADCTRYIADQYRVKFSLIVKRKVRYFPVLTRNIKDYWNIDMGQAMEYYKEMGIMAGAEPSDYENLYLISDTFVMADYRPILQSYGEFMTKKTSLIRNQMRWSCSADSVNCPNMN